jgi:BlaI family penicillinase repressor
MKRSLPPLGDLEHEVLALLWKYGELTAYATRQKLPRKLNDSTIRTVLRRLEEKRYVTHVVVSGTFIYRPAVTAEGTAAAAVQNIVERFCGGSLERALVGLVEAGLVDSNDLKLIIGKLKRSLP